MAVTVTANLTTASLCETTSGWSTGDTNDTFQIQGSYCLGLKVSQTTSAVAKYDLGSGGTDMSNGEHIYAWMMVTGRADSKANGGFRIYIEDTSGNNGTWYVGGYDTADGWTPFIIDPGSTPTTGSGIINTSSIRYIGVQAKITSKALGNTPNFYWDAVRYGTGLTITSGTGDTATLEDFYTSDSSSTNKYGVIQKVNGVYFVQGKLIIGTNATDVNFVQPAGKVLVFKDAPVSSTFYEISAVGYASGTSNITFNATIINSDGSTDYLLDFSDSNLDTVYIDGCAFISFKNAYFPSWASVVNSTFQDGTGVIYPSTSVFEGNKIYSHDGTRALKVIANNNISSCSFIDNVNATWYDTAGTYTDDSNLYSGNTKDVENSSSGLVTINASGSSTISENSYTNTGGGTTSISNGTTFKLTGLVDNTEVRIYTSDLATELYGIENSSGGTVIYSYSSTVTGAIVMIYAVSYEQIRFTIDLDGSDISIPVQQQKDRWYKNPT